MRASFAEGWRAGKTAIRSFSSALPCDTDVIIVGSGHNGLVAATLLARSNLRVQVLEQKAVIGGACRTEHPFVRAPNLSQSTGAYLLGVMPPELIKFLGIKLRLMRRDPHYFLPTTDTRYLLFGSDAASTKEQISRFFSYQDWKAHCALQEELAALRQDLAPALLRPPAPLEETAQCYIRPALREAFMSMCRGTVRQYLDRFDFKSGILRTMYATTDGFSGMSGAWDQPGGGYNFLLHNMCRLPEADGTWMIVEGGMGKVTQELSRVAREAGAQITTSTPVDRILVENGVAVGVELQSGITMRSRATVVNADPFTLRSMVDPKALSSETDRLIQSLFRPGMSMKVNLALSALPRYTCLQEDLGQHRTTTHLLPTEGDPVQATERAYQDAAAGRLPDFPTMEVYTQTTIDTGLQDAAGRHSAALFVQWVPNQIEGSSWEAEKSKYVDHLLGLWDRFAPGVSALVDDIVAFAPGDIESHFGITSGHIHHVCNSISFTDRFPYKVPGVEALFSCSAGTHPGGSVLGCAGWNAAAVVAKCMETEPAPGWLV